MPWSSLAKNWGGFRPVAYSLGDRTMELSLTTIDPVGGEGKQDAVTLGALFQELGDSRIQDVVKDWRAVKISTNTGACMFSGPSFNLEMAKVVFELKRDGVNAFEAMWFWYDTDTFSAEPMDRYQFFVVCKDAIVREDVAFVDDPQSCFDPSVFRSLEDEDTEPFWNNDAKWEEARAAYWYRRFSQDTQLGRLMLMRPDQPLVPYFQDESLTVSTFSFRALSEMRALLRSILVAVLILLGLLAILVIRR